MKRFTQPIIFPAAALRSPGNVFMTGDVSAVRLRGELNDFDWTTLSSFRPKERNVERGYRIEVPQAFGRYL
jgi:hypothetical protein